MFTKNLNIAAGTKVGSLRFADFQFECVVLENSDCAISLSSIHKNFGLLGNSPMWLLAVLEDVHSRISIPTELFDAYRNPLTAKYILNEDIFTLEIVALPTFVETCEILYTATTGNPLFDNNKTINQSAKKILNFMRSTNLYQEIEEITGYSLVKENAFTILYAYYTKHTNDRAFLWIKTFPKLFWIAIFEVHDLNWVIIRENPSKIARILYDIIFARLSDSVIDRVRSTAPKRSYKRKGNQPQQNEHPEINEYLISILTLLKVTNHNWPVFLQLLNRTHPVNQNYTTKLPLLSNVDANEKVVLSSFNKILLK